MCSWAKFKEHINCTYRHAYCHPELQFCSGLTVFISPFMSNKTHSKVTEARRSRSYQCFWTNSSIPRSVLMCIVVIQEISIKCSFPLKKVFQFKMQMCMCVFEREGINEWICVKRGKERSVELLIMYLVPECKILKFKVRNWLHNKSLVSRFIKGSFCHFVLFCVTLKDM